MIDHFMRTGMDSGIRVEGIKIPVYTGRLEDAARLIYDQME